jgi:hypothetical protein
VGATKLIVFTPGSGREREAQQRYEGEVAMLKGEVPV